MDLFFLRFLFVDSCECLVDLNENEMLVNKWACLCPLFVSSLVVSHVEFLLLGLYTDDTQ